MGADTTSSTDCSDFRIGQETDWAQCQQQKCATETSNQKKLSNCLVNQCPNVKNPAGVYVADTACLNHVCTWPTELLLHTDCKLGTRDCSVYTAGSDEKYSQPVLFRDPGSDQK